ncbi:MAG: hypothetical protein WBC96_02515 [Thermodesulfobacteriota bacterium]
MIHDYLDLGYGGRGGFGGVGQSCNSELGTNFRNAFLRFDAGSGGGAGGGTAQCDHGGGGGAVAVVMEILILKPFPEQVEEVLPFNLQNQAILRRLANRAILAEFRVV